MLGSSNRLICIGGPDLQNTGDGGTRFGDEFATPASDVADRFERMASDVAEYAFLHNGSFSQIHPDRGIGRPEGIAELLIDRFPAIASSWPDVHIFSRIPSGILLSEMLGTPGDLEGVMVYMDPPYAGTSGYGVDLSRTEVVQHAVDLSSMGASVSISEAEALPELVYLGWHAADITNGIVGPVNSFTTVRREILTMSSEPRYRVPHQTSLFA